VSEQITIHGIALDKPKISGGEHLIPAVEDYEIQGEEATALALGFKHKRPVMLTGHTGTGKNAAIRWFANKMGLPVYVVSLAEGTTTDQLIGMPIPVSGKGGIAVEWRDGSLPTALRTGGILVLDEINAADERTLMRLHDFLATEYKLNIYEKPDGAEYITPHASFMLVATANPADSGQYAGARVLNEATLDRFIVAEVDYLGLKNPEKEAAVIARATNIKHSRASRIVEVFNVVRRAAGLGEPVLEKVKNDDGTETERVKQQPLSMFVTASTRRAIDIALLSSEISMMAAVEIAFTNKINGEDRPVVHKLFLDAFAADEEGQPVAEEVASA
jgi:MoxR-like ATPase